MSVYVDQMFNATANSTSLTGLNSGITASVGTYPVPWAGRIIGVMIGMAGQAASSLLEALRVDLGCASWQPNTMRFGAFGGALRTAPAIPIPLFWWEVDEPVNTSQPITGQYLFNVAAVTPGVQVFGQFSTNPFPMPNFTMPIP